MPDVREKLVELLCEAHSKATDAEAFADATYAQQLEMEADHLIANGVTIQRWIPAEEQVPEELKNVLAYTAVGSFAETAHWTGYRFEKTWDFEVLYGVSHWMPLPEPPKEE